MIKTLLISETTLKTYSVVNENLDSKYLLSTIQMTQGVDLDTLIGTALRTKLESLVQSGEIRDDANKMYKELLDNYITDYLIYKCLANLQLAINYKNSNSGTYSNDDERKNHLEYRNQQLLTEQYNRNASAYATKITDYLTANVSSFPEYRRCTNYRVAEDEQLCGIYFESEPCKYNYIGK